MSHFRPYPDYKDTGVEWLGEVPAHWSVDCVKWSVASCQNGVWGADPKDDGSDVHCVRVADFDRHMLRTGDDIPTKRSVSELEQRTRGLNPGNLLLEKSGGGDNQPVGAVVLYTGPSGAVCSNFIARMELTSESDPSFWRYMHFALYSVRINTRSIKQTSGIQNLDQRSYLQERVPFPPHSEQMGIANHLDRLLSRIDTLIERKTRFIELLKEKRQALIAHAVTKGLNPDVPMKNSGIEWLGEVPAHWITLQLGRVTVNRCDGPFGSGLKSGHYQDRGVRVIRLQNIGSAEFRDTDQAFIAMEHWVDVLGGGHEAIDGDLLIAGLGDENNPLGRACVTPPGLGKALVKADCYRFRLDAGRVCPHFAAFQLTATARAECGAMATGATRDRLNLGLASSRRLVLPSIREQKKIVAYVQRHLESLDRLSDMTGQSIRLLQERRSALITAAVTGKIDLRDAA